MSKQYAPQKHTDIPQHHIMYKLLPKKLKSYIQLLRLDRPVGVLFLFIPCLWGMALAGSFTHIGYFFIGSVLMRSAGCVYNDIIDHDIDAKVERTMLRPLACGSISIKSAIFTMISLMGISAVILLQFNWMTIYFGIISIALVGCYPWMKRITYWPQLFLGITFNWGVIMAVAATSNTLSFKTVLIYLYGILWTLFYDTIYAHQDKDDDAIVGVKSSAIKLGNKTKYFLTIIILLQSIILLFICGFTGLIPAIISAAVLLTTDLDKPSSCLSGFKYCQFIGWATFAIIVFNTTCQ